ncbi:uncharacterized protein LOC127291380 [Leptopilina boulardi]|uniref:uncharacterized protein LOC127291380 n=1 Tax=Leptopilina boulardi TaxID=63433 RepID=UPI0021F5D2F9|nr:uncharacterized protein LOC127291380 [Leptopilina boulardi]XP_051176430.1 uncharacterized protein LOC127291380 [Leptopilina boulardi]
MESPLAEDCVVNAAQEDSTSVMNPEGASEILPTTSVNNEIIINDKTTSTAITNEMISKISSESSECDENSSTTNEKENLSTKLEINETSENELSKNNDNVDENNDNSDNNMKSLQVSRKRPAADFLPLSGEIKKIGVEISEEQAQQLKNEVRRLSPIHVSLRERTLGEISLISTEPRVFVDDNIRILKKNNDEEMECLKVTNQIDTRSENSNNDSYNSRVENCVKVTETCVINNNDDDDDNNQSEKNSSTTDLNCSAVDFDESTTTIENTKGLRELVLVLSRVDAIEQKNNSKNNNNSEKIDEVANCLDKMKNNEKEKISEPEIDSSRTLTSTEEESIGLVIERCVCYVHEQSSSSSSSSSEKNELFLVEKLEKKEELTIDDRMTTRKTSQIWESNNVIEKIEVDEEIIFSNSTLGIDDIQTTVLNVGENPLELETIGLTSSEIQVAVDTEETETTETGSDSSEVVASMNAVQFSVDHHNHHHHHHVISNHQIPCTENDPLICDDITPDIMTRLEPERPEAFTEDSAESLALATGSRDEVRSDGSDSGLGSEIPGDSGQAPAPESDSETSFLDRIPDEILSDKDKTVNQLETYVPDVNGQCIPQTSLPTFRSPSKSNLKRRLVDCMEGEPNAKRTNADEPPKKKRNIQFDAVTVYYFPRAQGFTCVPSQGGSTLGMSATHTHAERFSLSEHATEQRRLHRARLAQLRTERAANRVAEAASSSEDPSDDTDEEPSDAEELDIDSYYFLQPVPTWQRRALLRAAGVRRIDAVEKDECRDIRASREHCGCGCKGYCDPESCPCSRANVKCQVDRAGFPCGCSRDGCANSSGRIEFNPVRVRTHFIHTLMRLELEKKQRDEEHTDPDLMENNHHNHHNHHHHQQQQQHHHQHHLHQDQGTGLRDVSLGSVIDNSAETCMNGGGFTTLHYESHESVVSSCQGGGGVGSVTGVREDSLDLYAIRDDCYSSEDAVDSSQNSQQRKLHPEFHQTFQTFPGHPNSFQQNTYADYQTYQNLPSTSRGTPFQPQFPVTSGGGGNNSGFSSHYSGYATDLGTMQLNNCQTHTGQHSTTTGYETTFAQDDVTGSQYTNLNSVQPMNAVVQQMGKLEPFSELLAGRYSYYGELDPQSHGNYHANNGTTKIETEKIETINDQQLENSEECDENFGEIIKKSMVETVSA